MTTRVEVDEHSVRVHRSDDVETISWGELIGAAIQTTAAGPVVEDAFWILARHDNTIAVVPWEAEGADLLLSHLQRLPDFDNTAVIAAAKCLEEQTFICWQR